MPSLHHPNAKVERLKKIELFEHADRKALEHLASAADEAVLSPGQKLVAEGHRHNEGYVIVSGSVQVEIGGEVVAEVGAGGLIGELGLFGANVVASATVSAVTETSVLVIPYNRFDTILDENPSFTKSIAKQLSIRLQKMDDLYEDR